MQEETKFSEGFEIAPIDKGRRSACRSEGLMPETKNNFLPYRKDLKDKARDNRKNLNRPEAKFWYEILSNRKFLGYRFLRQKPVSDYILDFFCSELKLGIEIDGENHNEQVEYDKMRTLNLNNIGIKIIRYSNADIMCNLEGVYLDLKQKVKEREEEL
ncbi:MAG: endonuclease domain-containing protein [Candidatus Tenebribacter burtonii]|nr:endonuclease domain-containing protein [Candidatus Tenebribacter burtonii]